MGVGGGRQAWPLQKPLYCTYTGGMNHHSPTAESGTEEIQNMPPQNMSLWHQDDLS